jgi:hypothetical protein
MSVRRYFLRRAVMVGRLIVAGLALFSLVGCGSGGGGSSGTASGHIFHLSYTLADGSKLTAVVHGTLQPDQNTLLVDSVEDFATVDGVPGPSLPLTFSYDAALAQPVSESPTLTLDGSYMDLLACADAACNAGFGFATGNRLGSTIGDFFAGNASFGNAIEHFNPANYKLEASG